MFYLPTGEDMRLYVQTRHTEAMAIVLRLADKRREHTHSSLRSQAVCLARRQCSFWLSVRQTTAVAGRDGSRVPWERGHLGRFRRRRDACTPRKIGGHTPEGLGRNAF